MANFKEEMDQELKLIDQKIQENNELDEGDLTSLLLLYLLEEGFAVEEGASRE